MKALVRFNYGDFYVFPVEENILKLFGTGVRVEEKGTYDNQSYVVSGKGYNIDIKLIEDSKVVSELSPDAMKILTAAEDERSKAQSKVWTLESEVKKLKEALAATDKTTEVPAKDDLI